MPSSGELVVILIQSILVLPPNGLVPIPTTGNIFYIHDFAIEYMKKLNPIELQISASVNKAISSAQDKVFLFKSCVLKLFSSPPQVILSVFGFLNMDKFSLKKRKRAKKRSQSSSSSSQSSSSSSQDEKFKKRQHCLDGGQLGRSLKKRKRKESFSESSGSSSSESGRDKIRKKRRKLKKREKKERKDKRKKEKREKRKKSGKEKKDASELLGTAVTGEGMGPSQANK